MDNTTCYCRNSQGALHGQREPHACFKLHDWHRGAPRWRCQAWGRVASTRAGTAYAGIRTDWETYWRGATTLAEGLSMCATGRLVGVDKDMVNHRLPVRGEHCRRVMDYYCRDLPLRECQLAERGERRNHVKI